ncbi:MAG TPA: hypothetical protein VLB69_08540 [Rudaea sp.]|nr:hypothetical protein [Rudaea sp.]
MAVVKHGRRGMKFMNPPPVDMNSDGRIDRNRHRRTARPAHSAGDAGSRARQVPRTRWPAALLASASAAKPSASGIATAACDLRDPKQPGYVDVIALANDIDDGGVITGSYRRRGHPISVRATPPAAPIDVERPGSSTA